MEDGCTEEEADDDRTAADHADDTDHGSRQAQCVEIYEIGSRKEDADEDDAPVPVEWGGVLLCWAGKEASGTGNMKLMMNGAVTIGTLDGANVEMFEQLGADNMFLFGLHADEAEALRAAGYDPQAYVRRSPWLGRVLERMSRGYADGESYADLVSSLLYGGDPYLLLADFDDYAATHERLYTTIAGPAARARLSLVNIARSGIFAADRAVREYAERIWEVHA